jgi:hypothetical protein
MLLGIALLYFALVGWLLYKAKRWSRRVVILAVAILIPNADDWYYRYELAQYCRNEAGYKVYEQLSRKEGLLVSEDFVLKDSGNYVAFDAFPHLPFIPFVEWEGKVYDGKINEYARDFYRSDRLPGDAGSKPYVVETSRAAYELVYSEVHTWPFLEAKYTIKHRQSGKVISEVKSLHYYGGWYPRAWIGAGALVGGCDVSGRVLDRNQWQYRTEFILDRETLIRKTFTKD